MRFRLTTALAASLAMALPAAAQKAQAPAKNAQAQPNQGQAGKPANQNPVVATVNGDPIHMADIMAAAEGVPPQLRAQIPQDQLVSRLIDQVVAQKALLIEARKEGLDRDPAVQKQMQTAADQVLQNAVLRKQVLPKLTEEAIKAQYDKQFANKPGEPEVHARHILVDSEAKAKDIIAQLNKGAKFDELAKKYGDPKDAATQQGGDLGFFKKGDMLPEFSAAAFALKPNQITQTPVHTRYGWHVIQTLETRTSQPPTYDQVHDEIKQQLLQQNIKAAVDAARAQVKVVVYNADGTPAKPAAPAGAPAAPASK